MRLPHWFTGGVLATLGFILSPLSWWNDLFVNLPLAYGAGLFAGSLRQGWFMPGMIAGYWLSNVVGLILMHIGIRLGWYGRDRRVTRRELAWDLALSIGYTALIFVLIKSGTLVFPESQISQLFGEG